MSAALSSKELDILALIAKPTVIDNAFKEKVCVKYLWIHRITE